MSTVALPRPVVARSDRALGVARSPVLVWVALCLNVLAFSGLPIVIPNPITLGQLVTQGALVAALLLALSNLYGVVRPNTILVRLTLGDASPYLLELVLAASLLAAPAGQRRR